VKLTIHLVPRSKNAWSYTSTPIRLHGVVFSLKKKDMGFTSTLTFTSSYSIIVVTCLTELISNVDATVKVIPILN